MYEIHWLKRMDPLCPPSWVKDSLQSHHLVVGYPLDVGSYSLGSERQGFGLRGFSASQQGRSGKGADNARILQLSLCGNQGLGRFSVCLGYVSTQCLTW